MAKPKGRIQQPIDKHRKFVTIKLLTKTTDMLERIAKVKNITRSYLISNIIEEYLKKYDMKLLEERELIKEKLTDFKN